ncbi:Stk1 family PASTA domain-containing Ser/Thr kinase [soil metagenome]
MNPASDTDLVAGAGPIAVGALLGGRYRMTARIGAGGMATIYRAYDESLDRDVAVKVLHPHLADDASFLARFRTEARNAAALLHPHIVNVFDQGVADLPYIVMELVDGPSVRQLLDSRGRLPPAEMLAVVGPVCEALARAHASDVVHRDIKPENILIAAGGNPKVADFGIARAAAATSHTATGTLIGSVHYMAPEIVDGQEATDRTDQYAVGVLIFELLTGRKSLPADSPMAVAVRHAREPVPPPSRYVTDAPRALDRVVAKATAAQPAKRYPDMAALAMALRAAVPGPPQPVTVPVADSEATVVIPATSPATTTTAVTTTAAGGATGAVAASGQRRRRPRRTLLLLVALLLMAGASGAGVWNWVLAPVQRVPDLGGTTVPAARDALAGQGMSAELEARRYDLSAPAGTVLDQDPDPGSPLRRGGVVAVVVSRGPAQVSVPDVVGGTRRQAVELLSAAPYAFDVAVRERFSDTVATGRVIAAAPEASTTVDAGRRLTLTVSKGIEQVAVPKVRGLPRAEAVTALRRAKLRAAATEAYSDRTPEAGTVVRQDVRAGRTVDKGTPVAITVSLGPLHFAMPNVNGHPIEQARAELAALTLRVTVSEQPRPQIGPFRRGDFGLVEAQVPEADATVRREDRVDLYTFSQAAEEAEG